MPCPQCDSDEFSPSGVCLICGFHLPKQDPIPEDDPGEEVIEEAIEEDNDTDNISGAINIDYSEGTKELQQENTIPDWRQELSERLNAIKQKRALAATGTRQENKTTPVGGTQLKPVEITVPIQPKPTKKPAPKPSMPRPAAPRQITLQPVHSELASDNNPVTSPDPREIQNLIDNAVSRQVDQALSIPDIDFLKANKPESFVEQEGKLILLSRTLSGLIDLILVMFCTGLCLISADLSSGIVVLDKASLISISLLFLFNHFLYSLFFLSASGQTIGMMITDLHVVGINNTRPSIRRVWNRSWAFLISLLVMGIGLILCLFDRDNRCFHDRLSGTFVVRL
jgi:uncharacterized RDD family membrane protein YckC